MNEEEKEAISNIVDIFIETTKLDLYNSQCEELNIKKVTLYESAIKDIETVLNLVQKQQVELEKKDKIIDLMAIYIEMLTVKIKLPYGGNMLWDIDEIKQYFERKAKNE